MHPGNSGEWRPVSTTLWSWRPFGRTHTESRSNLRRRPVALSSLPRSNIVLRPPVSLAKRSTRDSPTKATHRRCKKHAPRTISYTGTSRRRTSRSRASCVRRLQQSPRQQCVASSTSWNTTLTSHINFLSARDVTSYSDYPVIDFDAPLTELCEQLAYRGTRSLGTLRLPMKVEPVHINTSFRSCPPIASPIAIAQATVYRISKRHYNSDLRG